MPELIEAVSRLALRRPRVRLEIVGENRTQPRIDIDGLVGANAARDRVTVRSYVSDAQLETLYRQARAFAFLSDYEGFGMTPTEALAAGVPIVVLDTEVTREIYGSAAAYVPRPDPELIAAALERTLYDPAARTALAEAARSVLARYSWHVCGQRTLQTLCAAAG
jgi:glycosyltransferase involved in cell wall biosynthesis